MAKKPTKKNEKQGRIRSKKDDILKGSLKRSEKAPSINSLPAKLLNMRFMRDAMANQEKEKQEENKKNIEKASRWKLLLKSRNIDWLKKKMRPRFGRADLQEIEDEEKNGENESDETELMGRRRFGDFNVKKSGTGNSKASDSNASDSISADTGNIITNIVNDKPSKTKASKRKALFKKRANQIKK